MKGTTPEWTPVRRYMFQRRGRSQRRESAMVCKPTREPGPILMCWRAFRPERNEDRDVESMSSTSNDNIDADRDARPPAAGRVKAPSFERASIRCLSMRQVQLQQGQHYVVQCFLRQRYSERREVVEGKLELGSISHAIQERQRASTLVAGHGRSLLPSRSTIAKTQSRSSGSGRYRHAYNLR